MFVSRSVVASVVVAGVSFFTTASRCDAVTLLNSLSAVPGVTWDALPANSFDSPTANSFYSQLAPYVDQQAYHQTAYFGGGSNGGSLDVLMFAEITAHEQQNELLLCGSAGCSVLLGGGSAPGNSASASLGSADEGYFLLNSPGGQWGSFAELNDDGLDHFLFFRVLQDANVTITPTTAGGGSLTLSLIAGDLLVGIEDLSGGLPGSDRDYNDLFFHARASSRPDQHDVPEPATLSLLAFGSLAAARLRRRSAEK